MTVICAAYNGTMAAIASDSRSRGGAHGGGVAKVWRAGLGLVGFAGPDALKLPLLGDLPVLESCDRVAFLDWCEDLMGRVDRHGRARGHGEVVGGVWQLDVAMLCAYPMGIAAMGCDLGAYEVPRAWHAIGSGGPEARGAMWTVVYADGKVPDPSAVVLVGVMAACALDSTCGGNVNVLEVRR